MAKSSSTHDQETLIKEKKAELEKEELKLKKIAEKINELIEEKDAIDANCQTLRKTLKELESSLAVLTPPRVVKLARKDKSLGFSIMGGKEINSPIYISNIIPGGVAENQGELRRGDQILSIDGESVEEATHDETVALIKKAKDTVKLVVRYNPDLL